MGHQRLGESSKTQKWTKVVEKITSAIGASTAGTGVTVEGTAEGVGKIDVGQVAAQILQAAEGGLAEAANDPGLQSTVFLLTQIVLAARQDDWQAGLDTVGIKLDAGAAVFPLTAEVQRGIHQHLPPPPPPPTTAAPPRPTPGAH